MNNLNLPLILTIIFSTLLVIIILGFIINYLHKKKKNQNNINLINEIFISLGGKENIEELTSKGSRLYFKLKDNTLFNEEKIKNLGVTSIIKMSSKTTIVIGSIAQDIEKAYKN